MTRLLLAEWTKLRSVGRWVITLLGAALLTVGLSVLAASGNRTDMNQHPNFVVGPNADPVADGFYFVHQPITGDTTLTVRVASLTPPQEPEQVNMGQQMTLMHNPGPFAGATAGIVIKDGARSGSSYAAVMLTGTNGVRMQSDFTDDRAGSRSSGTRWLRLVRTGNTITGYESADGATWQKIGTATPKNLPATAEIGFYVSSAPSIYMTRGGGSSSVGERPTQASATFDDIVLDGASQWKGDQIGNVEREGKEGQPRGGELLSSGNGFTVTGSGKVGPQPPDDDVVEGALIGVIAGLMALICVGVLFATSEYRRGMIRTTFAATPRRGLVLTAKAVVLGVTCYAVSLVGVVAAYTLALPTMRKHGFAPPAFPRQSIMDGPVLRALLLTAGFMALVAVFGMGIGMLLRRSALAITLTIVLVLLPIILGTVLPGTSPRWLMYTTLAGGMATQRAKPPTITLAEPWAMIGPWAGIGVVVAYAALALGLAWWRLTRTDA
jgi:ABC-type transport system involved in multi-copper enzyme maturation permease subunit